MATAVTLYRVGYNPDWRMRVYHRVWWETATKLRTSESVRSPHHTITKIGSGALRDASGVSWFRSERQAILAMIREKERIKREALSRIQQADSDVKELWALLEKGAQNRGPTSSRGTTGPHPAPLDPTQASLATGTLQSRPATS